MASVTGVTATKIEELLDEMLVSVEVDDSGQLIYTKRSGEQFNAGSLTDADLAVSASWPVHSIFISTTPTNPATLLGVGTWVQFAMGRTLVGQDSSQTEFDAVLETGGAKRVTLAETEMPVHYHLMDPHAHSIYVQGNTDYDDGVGNESGLTRVGGVGSGAVDYTLRGSTENSSSQWSNSAGGGQSHNNLQPYIVVYMWRRTA